MRKCNKCGYAIKFSDFLKFWSKLVDDFVCPKCKCVLATSLSSFMIYVLLVSVYFESNYILGLLDSMFELNLLYEIFVLLVIAAISALLLLYVLFLIWPLSCKRL